MMAKTHCLIPVCVVFYLLSNPIIGEGIDLCTEGRFGTMYSIDCSGVTEKPPEAMAKEIDHRVRNANTITRLTSLVISHTSLTEVPPSVCRLSTLTVLMLNNNRLTRLPDNCFDNMTNLKSLDVSCNHLTELQDGLFDGLDNLRRLKLHDNYISSIGLRVFANASNLRNLNYIDLSSNKLQSLEPWWYARGISGTLERRVLVNLSHNLISTFTNAVGLKYNCSMPRVFVKLDLYNNSVRHAADLARGWDIDDGAKIFCLWRVVNYSSHSDVWLRLAGNPIECDCADFHYLKLFKPIWRIGAFDNTYCYNPISLYQRAVAQVPLDQLVCQVTERCPSRCRCVYRPANATMHVYCSGTNMSLLPTELPQLLKSFDSYKLDFSNNRQLHRLENRSYFVNTSFLDASNCGLNEIESDAWKDIVKIPKVFLAGNSFWTLPKVTGTPIAFEQLSLGRNKWSCSCENSWMSDWLKSTKDRLQHSDEILCDTPSRLHGKNVMKISKDEFCVDPITRAVSITVFSVVGIVLGVILAILVVYRLRVRFHARWNFHPFDRDECVGEDMDYDVFLCCSSEDDRLHGRKILELLEANNYYVCYHLRDFEVGETIDDNICRSVIHSKRTLCLMSEHFLRSGYCKREFDVALHHNVTLKRKKRLVVLMMLDNLHLVLSDETPDTDSLRQYLRQYTYIDYRADDWLQKLLYALPVRGMVDSDDAESDSVVYHIMRG